ncbi:MAG: putative nucleotidyltransferase with HDIG domain [Chlamydiales bacterium]|jgi:putative nucleotidyltransferase with HDIG domain
MNDQLKENNQAEDEFSLSREQGYFDKSLGIRLLIGAIFAICLFSFLHFREIRVEMLELDMEAERYVVSQVDFEFFDVEATALLRDEAVRDIGSIYKFGEKEIKKRRAEFEEYLVNDEEWRKVVEHSTFDEMYSSVSTLERALLKVRFTNSRTLHKLEDVNLPTINFQTISPTGDMSQFVVPEETWQQLILIALSAEEYRDETKEFVSKYFREKEFFLQQDEQARGNLRNLVKNQVPRKFTKVGAGDLIIDQGEVVGNRHLTMMQAMKKAMSASRNLWHPLTLLGSAIVTLVSIFIGMSYLENFHSDVSSSNKKLFLLVTIVVLALIMSKVMEFLLLRTDTNLFEFVRFPLLLPFPAILISSLMSTGVAVFASGFLAVVMSTTLAVQHPGFLIVNLLPAVVAILSTSSLRKRKEVFVICIKAWLCCITLVTAFHFYDNTLWGVAIFADIFTTALFMVLTGVLIVGLLPLLEAGFRIMTDVTLMEFMDPNHHLLRRLAIEAPGTYQHSVVVGNLAEAGAVAIGANGLFCRVSTLYHDIGKLATPHYFSENQQGGVNIHQLLTPLESAQVIISHVSEGVAMARKAGLPEQFIDVIKEHHGTTLVFWFYSKQLESFDGDESKVDERDFRYMGPKPRRKESAIIMIADSLEAASRSLDEVNEHSVTELLDNIVREKIRDQQFDRSLLTFEELVVVKKAMVKTLVAVGHSRVKYPKPKKEESRVAAESKAG